VIGEAAYFEKAFSLIVFEFEFVEESHFYIDIYD
jgi:hypothetical protein